MVETIEKYNLKEIIKNIEKHILSCNLSDSETKNINIILFRMKNIDVIIENIDEDLITSDIESDYKNLISYCQNIVKIFWMVVTVIYQICCQFVIIF